MKNKKGFTLVELLAVIAILGIVITITGVAVSGVLKDSKKGANNIQKDEIKKAARYYVTKNMSTCKNGCAITIQTLISEGYLDNSNNMPEGNIKVVKEGNKFKYYANLIYNGMSIGNLNEFSYTGNVQTVILSKGKYKLEVWGAQGGNYNNTTFGGKGGYSEGIITLNEDTKLYVYVGGQPSGYAANRGGTSVGGFNGGGKSTTYEWDETKTYGLGGGGASDVRIKTDSLYARVIVAGGGSGATNRYSGYAGGGQQSLGYSSTYYATQTKAGSGGSFGIGGSKSGSILNRYGPGGGGGGWYGGGVGSASDTSLNYARYSGGGSGYVYTSSTASNYPSGCLLNSSYYLSNAETIAGNQSFLSPDGTTETGHSGHGYVRITKQ